MMKERLQKLMAQANVGSRRANEGLIQQGRVRVNGKVATLGDKADPETDMIEVDGEKLDFTQRRIYILINKPKQVLTTNIGHRNDDRRTLLDLIPFKEHLFTIGRLDADSEGMVVLTNDGNMANKLTHPRFRHTKVYRVVVEGLPTAASTERWQRGVYLDPDGMTAPCLVEITKGGSKQSTLKITMTEGKKRQIRRVASLLDHPVIELKRTQIGMLEMGDLRTGEWRELDAREIQLLSMRSPDAKTIANIRPTSTSPRRDRAAEAESRNYGDSPRRPRPDETSAERPRRTRTAKDNPDIISERPRRTRPIESSTETTSDRPRRPRPTEGRTETASDRPRRPRPTEGGNQRNSNRTIRTPRPTEGRTETASDDRPRRPHPTEGRTETASDRPRHPRPTEGSSQPNSDRSRRPRPTESNSQTSSDRPRRPRPPSKRGVSPRPGADRPTTNNPLRRRKPDDDET